MARLFPRMRMLWLLGFLWCYLPVAAQERIYTIQVASLPTAEEARELVGRLKTAGIEAYIVRVTLPGMGMRYRVRHGRFKSSEEARVVAERAVKRGVIATYIVTREESPPERTAERRNEPARPRIVPSLIMNSPFSAPRSIVETPEPPSVARPHSPLPTIDIFDERWQVAPPEALPDRGWQAVHFIDQLTGWIAGESGALYRTTDGGRTWKASPIETRASLYSLCFIDWNLGWVLGKVGSDQSTLLFSTVNGGRTWTRTAIPEVEKVVFVDASVGWALGAGRTLLKTIDGGLNWAPIESDPFPKTGGAHWNFDDLHFSDRDTGWLAVSRRAPDRIRVGGLWRTNDAGLTWMPAPLPAELRDREGEGIPGRWREIRFFSSKEGVITGELLEAGQASPFSLSTRDGGQSWSMNRFTFPGASVPLFIDPVIGWTILSFEQDHHQTQILATQNGGSSWAKEMSIEGKHRLLQFFLSRQGGWLIGEGGILMTYRDSTGIPKRLKN